MFSRWTRRALLLGVVVSCLGSLPATAAASGPRQYYGAWTKHPTHNYHYRHYYYKPTAKYSGYKHHYVVYHPSKPKYVYYYNPYKKTYWGRCPTERAGEPVYSLLPEQHRKPTLQEIPEAAFPQPGQVPAIPESTDNAALDLPPDDVPPGVAGVPTSPGPN